MELTCERADERTAVTVGGRLTASQMVEVRAALLEALTSSPRVDLVLGGVAQADLTLLQLLCAAQRTAAGRKVTFAIRGLESAPPVLDLIRDSGAERCAGCTVRCTLSPGSPAHPGPPVRGGEGSA